MGTVTTNIAALVRAARRATATAIVAGALAAAGLAAGTTPARADDGATVFMYHRFGEQTLPATNIRVEQFEAHIREYTNGKFNPIGLPEIINTLRRRKPLPENAVGISIDDAYKSVYTVAWPLLKAAGLPFTLFVATDQVDSKAPGYMTWDQIRELARAGVTIGSQSAAHLHMPDFTVERVVADITKSNARFEQELGKAPELFAYPYGEVSTEVRAQIVKAGFIAAFGQHSGVLHSDSDLYYLPRFAMNENYGDLSRFRLAANAQPLRVREITPADPKLTPAGNPPSFGFTVFGEALKNLGGLNCYASGQGKARIERLGSGRIEVRLERKFPPGRARVNCTMPAGGGKWRWFGMQFYIPKS
jgi:peptidoglycan/xylan/chitin deacetylase (PgdA/CDA1 family)